MTESLKQLAERYGLTSLYVFGSRGDEVAIRMRGGQAGTKAIRSDVDIAVQVEQGRRLGGRERVDLAITLEDLLGATRVDLVVLAEADPFLAVEIVRGALLYCKDSVAQAEEELFILRRAGDLAPYALQRQQVVLAEGGR